MCVYLTGGGVKARASVPGFRACTERGREGAGLAEKPCKALSTHASPSSGQVEAGGSKATGELDPGEWSVKTKQQSESSSRPLNTLGEGLWHGGCKDPPPPPPPSSWRFGVPVLPSLESWLCVCHIPGTAGREQALGSSEFPRALGHCWSWSLWTVAWDLLWTPGAFKCRNKRSLLTSVYLHTEEFH